MSLITNADSRVTPAMHKADDQRGKRADYIDGKVAAAKVAEREQGHGAPDVRFSWQRDAFTEDSKFDATREALEGRTDLPIKERVITPSGDIEIVLGDAALEAVREGKFCFKCGDRQPETPEGIDEAWLKREQFLGTTPDGCRKGDHCVTCLAALRPRGDDTSKHGKPNVSAEQLRLAMTLGIPIDTF